MSRLRQRIAERLVAGAADGRDPHDVQRGRHDRGAWSSAPRYKERFQKKHGVGLGFMSFFARACIAALQDVPAVNARDRRRRHRLQALRPPRRRRRHRARAGGAGRPRRRPHVVRRTSSTRSRGLAGLARDGKLALDDLRAARSRSPTAASSARCSSTPILNPPQSGILGMHKIEKRPVVVDDQIVIRPMMYVALSYDHRLVDGEQAVTFLVRVKERLEDPARLAAGRLMARRLRSRRHRLRARRLRGRDPRGAARHARRLRREGPDARRHVPQRRLHPAQGAARFERALSPGAATASRVHGIRSSGVDARPAGDDGAQGQGREAGLTQGVARLFKKNKIDWARRRAGASSRPAASSSTGDDGRDDRRGDAHPDRHRQRGRRRCPACRSTASASSARPRRSRCPRCRSTCSWSAAARSGSSSGSVWRRLGAKVTVVEFLDRIVPMMRREMARAAAAARSRSRASTFRFETERRTAERTADGVRVTLEPKRASRRQIDADVVLVAVGRRRTPTGSGARELGVAFDERGRIVVNERFETNVAGVFAIGDVIAGPMLAHKAEDEGVAAVEMHGRPAGHVNYGAHPERRLHLAGAGERRDHRGARPRERGLEVAIGTFPFLANARARASTRRRAGEDRSPTPRPTASSASTSSARAPPT